MPRACAAAVARVRDRRACLPILARLSAPTLGDLYERR